MRVFIVNRVKFNPIDTLYHGLYQVYPNETIKRRKTSAILQGRGYPLNIKMVNHFTNVGIGLVSTKLF